MARIKVKYKAKILYRGKERWGLADPNNKSALLNSKMRGKKHLEILNHECLHILFPDALEDEIEQKSIILTNTLWHDGYRKPDHSNKIPMQDGSI